ncbi:MAG: GAF domain-containing protein [Thermoleophilia bacterium]|nr:GAF domain-containing protein [Thermoleophilia bacterium]MDH5332381.1 GAF domain-containing protein [Thermoleophilia bacterium]
MTESAYRAVAAAGMLATEESHRRLLQSIVGVARAIFKAKAASVFLFDEDADELVFEAVSGEGEGDLVGMRMPSSTGIAGWVLVTRQPLVVDDLSADPRHARQAAEATGYVPNALVAVPLLTDERAIGVLNVLDRAEVDRPFSLAEMELLTLFADQAAIGLDLLRAGRKARSVAEGGDDERAAVVARLAELLGEDDDGAGLRLLEALERVLRGRG